MIPDQVKLQSLKVEKIKLVIKIFPLMFSNFILNWVTLILLST